MEKQIKLNEEKTITLKSSAATNILYKKLFREDILVKLADYSKNYKELSKMQERIKDLRTDSSKTQEEILAEMSSCLESDAYKATNDFSTDTLPKLAYIMYIEANEKIDTIFSKLTEEHYLYWLLSIDQDDLFSITGEVMNIWKSGAKTSSHPKN